MWKRKEGKECKAEKGKINKQTYHLKWRGNQLIKGRSVNWIIYISSIRMCARRIKDKHTKIESHLNKYHSHTKIMRGSLPLHCALIVIHLTYMQEFTFILVIQHIFLFILSDSCLHNSDWVFLMGEIFNLCGISPHTHAVTHTGLMIYLKPNKRAKAPLTLEDDLHMWLWRSYILRELHIIGASVFTAHWMMQAPQYDAHFTTWEQTFYP